MAIEADIKGVFKKSWNVFSNNFVTLIFGTFVALLLMVFVFTIPPLIFGIYYMCSQFIKKKKVKVSDIFYGFNYFFRSWGLALLLVLGVLGGFALFIVPGFLLMIVWQYAFAISVIEDRKIVDSIKRSFYLGKENFVFSLILSILLMVIGSIGAYSYIGTLVTIPFTILTTCFAYLYLNKKK